MNKFFNAIMFYSRLPVPKGIDCSPREISEALMFFPLVGLIVGALGYGGYYVTSLALPHDVAIIAAMVVMILATGALHEDGVADFCDGFGGGYGKEAILRIMKDSHIGTYGVIALIATLLARYTMLDEIGRWDLAAVMIASQGASRIWSILMVRTSTYARTEPSKSSHSALGLSNGGVAVALCFGMLPLWFVGLKFALIYLATMSVIFLLFRHYLHRTIGGFTGDTLGALQQFAEITFYLITLAIL